MTTLLFLRWMSCIIVLILTSSGVIFPTAGGNELNVGFFATFKDCSEIELLEVPTVISDFTLSISLFNSDKCPHNRQLFIST